MSMYCRAVGIALGVIVFFCDGPGYALFLDDETSSEQAHVEKKEQTRVKDTTRELTFVHIGAKKFTLPCKPAKSDVVIGMNPVYEWSLENGETPSLQNVDSLILHEFRAKDSGRYICSMSFTKEDQSHTVIFSHTVVGYHVRGELQALLIFLSNSCDKVLTREFEKILRARLSELVTPLYCEVVPEYTTCFPTLEKPLDKFILQVELKVTPFGKGWDTSCYFGVNSWTSGCYRSAVQSNLRQAEGALTKFMKMRKQFPLVSSNGSEAAFVNTFFNFLEDGKCQDGYGQMQDLEAHCPDCCILCPPGTYSLADTGSCDLCPVGTYSLHYGATFCIACHNNSLTPYPGAKAAADCMNMKDPRTLPPDFTNETTLADTVQVLPPQQFPVLMMVAFALPPFGCLCLIVLCCYCFRRRWQKSHSSTVTEGQTKGQEAASASASDYAFETSEDSESQPLTVFTPDPHDGTGDTVSAASSPELQALPGLAKTPATKAPSPPPNANFQ